MRNLIDFAPLLSRGALVTIAVALLALLLATLLGVVGAVAKLRGGRIARSIAAIYTTIVRGVPDLVLVLLIYFGGQRTINLIGDSLGLDYIEISKFWAGVISIGFIYGGYLTETFRGAYQSVPAGQLDAARSMGLLPWTVLRKVLAPQVIRLALPGYSNVWQVLAKSTAVISVIGLEDLVGLADKAGKATREPFLFFLIVIAVYLCLTSVSGWGFRRLERRLDRAYLR